MKIQVAAHHSSPIEKGKWQLSFRNRESPIPGPDKVSNWSNNNVKTCIIKVELWRRSASMNEIRCYHRRMTHRAELVRLIADGAQRATK
jgi:hypothetical protein